MSNIKRISKEIFAISSAIKIQLFASKVIFVIVAAPIANNRGNISHVFDTISEEESISSKKGGERVVWTRLNLSLTGEGDEKGGKERRTMRTQEGDIR